MITNLIAAVTIALVTNTTEVILPWNPETKSITVSVEEVTTYKLDVPGGAEVKRTNVLSRVESVYERAWMLIEEGRLPIGAFSTTSTNMARTRTFKPGTNSTLVLPGKPAPDYVPEAFKNKIPPGNWTPPLDTRLNPARIPDVAPRGDEK